MKRLELTVKAYEQYKQNVKGNETIPFDQAEKKLSRNVQLVKEEIKKHPENKSELVLHKFLTATYFYGNLHIKVRLGKIVGIKNHKGASKKFAYDEKRYNELSQQLGILDFKRKRVYK